MDHTRQTLVTMCTSSTLSNPLLLLLLTTSEMQYSCPSWSNEQRQVQCGILVIPGHWHFWEYYSRAEEEPHKISNTRNDNETPIYASAFFLQVSSLWWLKFKWPLPSHKSSENAIISSATHYRRFFPCWMLPLTKAARFAFSVQQSLVLVHSESCPASTTLTLGNTVLLLAHFSSSARLAHKILATCSSSSAPRFKYTERHH